MNRRAIEISRLSEIIQYAHQKGLSVFLFPTLHLQHLGHKEWRGVLKPQDPGTMVEELYAINPFLHKLRKRISGRSFINRI